MSRYKRRARTLIDVGAFTEIIFGVVVGFILHLLKIDTLAQVSFLLGPALSANRYLLTQKIESEMAEVHALASIIDLNRSTDITQFKQMIDAYLEINEAEFQPVKDQIIEESTNKLRRLAIQKSSDELATGEYYNWLLPMIENSVKGSSIWAVSMMLDCEWDDSPYEERFLDSNINATKKQVELERIFIVERSKISDLLKNKGVIEHINNSGQYLKSWIVIREDLVKADPQLLKELGDGFIAFDKRVALVDMSTPDGMRGYVTMNTGQIQRLWRMFERLRIQGRTLDKNFSSPSP